MAQFQIALPDDILHGLFVGDGVARLLEEIMNQVLQAEITEHLQINSDLTPWTPLIRSLKMLQ